MNYTTWTECFQLLSEYTKNGSWIIYFEELQWMACYESDLLSSLKYVWDNFFKKNSQFRLILCGSATSFMLSSVVRSQALYNRSQTVIELKEFSYEEARAFLKYKNSDIELMDIYLSIGGIPEYLKRIQDGASLFLSLCDQSFTRDCFFLTEIDRIFISQLSGRKSYKRIIEFLAQKKWADREQILKYLKLSSSGKVSEVIGDLLSCHFIQSEKPFSLSESSKLIRYAISDNYLQFYYKFIHTKKTLIEKGTFTKSPSKALPLDSWRIWLGYSFERWCCQNSPLIAKALGFADVEYSAGPFYNRATQKSDPGFQIDLLFDRKDKVISVCEIKYTQKPVGLEIVKEFERKLEIFRPYTKKSIQKVLISFSGANPELKNHFDRIVDFKDINFRN